MRPALKIIAVAVILAASCTFATAQKRRPTQAKPKAVAGPKVTKIDVEGLRTLLKPDGKPRLINFWATWCDGCREEFPDLVKLDALYKGKIDFYTVSLDDLVDIRTAVPKFLSQMKATMPSYLLHAPDEDAAIATLASISPDFAGGLPFTVLFKPAGELSYGTNSKVQVERMKAEIDKLLTPTQ